MPTDNPDYAARIAALRQMTAKMRADADAIEARAIPMPPAAVAALARTAADFVDVVLDQQAVLLGVSKPTEAAPHAE